MAQRLRSCRWGYLRGCDRRSLDSDRDDRTILKRRLDQPASAGEPTREDGCHAREGPMDRPREARSGEAALDRFVSGTIAHGTIRKTRLPGARDG